MAILKKTRSEFQWSDASYCPHGKYKPTSSERRYNNEWNTKTDSLDNHDCPVWNLHTQCIRYG
jgi:hypothetical protein